MEKKDIEEIENMNTLLKNNYFKKIIPLIIFAIFLVLFLVLIVKITPISKKNSDVVLDEDALILIKEDEKYGFINSNGKKVIETKYDSADNYIGNYTKVKENDTYHIIDRNGKILHSAKSSNDIEYLNEYKVWIINGSLYDYSLKKLNLKNTKVKYNNYGYFKWINEKDKNAGIIDYTGKVTYTYKLEKEENNFLLNEIGIQNTNKGKTYYCTVSVDNKKFAIVNCSNGKVIRDYEESLITNKVSSCFEIKNLKNYLFKERIIIVNDDIVYTTKNKTEIVYNYEYYYNIYSPKERKNFYISKINGKKTDEEPKLEIDKKISNGIEEKLGIEKISCDEGYGLKVKNKNKIKCEWKEILYFDDNVMNYLNYKNKNYIIVKSEDEYKLMDYSKNKIISTFNTDRISIIDNSLFIEYLDKETNKKVVYSLLKNTKEEYDENVKIALYTNYYIVKTDEKDNYYNIKMKKIYSI